MEWLNEYDIDEIMEEGLLKDYIDEIIYVTHNNELQWEARTTNLLELESEKCNLLKRTGVYDRWVRRKELGRKLERLFFSEVVSNQVLVVCEYCYDGRTPWESETWVDVFRVKENLVQRLVDHEMCYDPEDYEYCKKVAETLLDAIRESYRRHEPDNTSWIYDECPFN